MLTLGGDLSDRDGMDGFTDPHAMGQVAAPAGTLCPAATAPHLVAVANAHEALRIDNGVLPPPRPTAWP